MIHKFILMSVSVQIFFQFAALLKHATMRFMAHWKREAEMNGAIWLSYFPFFFFNYSKRAHRRRCRRCSSTPAKSQPILPAPLDTLPAPVARCRGGHRGRPQRGGAHHAAGRPAVAQQRPGPGRPARQVGGDVAPRGCRQGIPGGFKVSTPTTTTTLFSQEAKVIQCL